MCPKNLTSILVTISISASWFFGQFNCRRVGLSASWFVGELSIKPRDHVVVYIVGGFFGTLGVV